MNISNDDNNLNYLIELKAQLNGSFIFFCKTFFKELTGRSFELSKPSSGESHHLTISRQFTRAFRNEINRLIINCPPGFNKSTMCSFFVSWGMSQYPDSNFIYVSYSHERAADHTFIIKKIMDLPLYRKLFNIEISKDSKAKDDFRTNFGGRVVAMGSAGSVTGLDAGFPNCNRFTGALIIDDAHKPDEVHSEIRRKSIILNYGSTLEQRLRSDNVPVIYVGHRVHEDDLPAYLLSGKDGRQWERVIITALDENDNATHPEVHSKESMILKRKNDEYVYSSQFNQNPQPAGGGIFKIDNFFLMDKDPDILLTFITADTAETEKTYNDATVFSFFGIYKIKDNDSIETDVYGLHWIDCVQLWIEPKDLKHEFLKFYSECSNFKIKPSIAAIEKKSTGVTLLSLLSDMRGIEIRKIERNCKSGNKIDRFLSIQPYLSKKLVSLPKYGKHTEMVINHCIKITANNSHRYDDIADTLYDGVKIGLIENSSLGIEKDEEDKIRNELQSHFIKINNLRGRVYGNL